MIKSVFLFLIFMSGCTSDKKNFSDVDTTLILDKSINNVQTNKSLSTLFAHQQLRVVRGTFLKKDYKLFKNGMPVTYVDIDSSSTKLSDWRNPKFYVNVDDFRIISDKKVNVSLIFRSTGQWFLIELIKKNDEWVINSFKDRQI